MCTLRHSPISWQCNLAVIRDASFKYVHFAGLPPLLFDLTKHPGELRERICLSRPTPVLCRSLAMLACRTSGSAAGDGHADRQRVVAGTAPGVTPITSALSQTKRSFRSARNRVPGTICYSRCRLLWWSRGVCARRRVQ